MTSKIEKETEQVRCWEKDHELYTALKMEPPVEKGTQHQKEHRQGDRCPNCKKGKLDYDGLLNLSCAKCGYALQGCFT